MTPLVTDCPAISPSSTLAANARPAQVERGVITYAIGSPTYAEMAVDLALSLKLHSSAIPRAVVTDLPHRRLRKEFDYVIPLRPELGEPLAQKLHFANYSPFQQTLFIDCDSLVVRDVSFIFDLCEPYPVAYTGGTPVTTGYWYADVAATLGAFGIPWLPPLNSGMLYADGSSASRRVFVDALAALDRYEECGFGTLHGQRSDEPALAVAFARHNILPLDDRGATSRTPVGITGPLDIDVVAGRCRFRKHGEIVEPAIMHFAGWKSKPTYERERLRLRLHTMFPSVPAASGAIARALYYGRRFGEMVRGGTVLKHIAKTFRPRTAGPATV